MGSLLGSLGLGGNDGLLSSVGSSSFGYGPESQCCDAVVDPISLLTAIGAIAAVSLFLRQAVIDFKVKGARSFRKERSSFLPDFDEFTFIADHFTDIMQNGNPCTFFNVFSVLDTLLLKTDRNC